jgi:hypothetical protein
MSTVKHDNSDSRLTFQGVEVTSYERIQRYPSLRYRVTLADGRTAEASGRELVAELRKNRERGDGAAVIGANAFLGLLFIGALWSSQQGLL